MRAYLLRSTGRLAMAEVADPTCGPDEVVVQTEAVSICSTDVSYFRGHLTPECWPIVPGHEYVGRVIKVGSALREFVQCGDRITYWGQTDFGGLAEYRAIRPLFATTNLPRPGLVQSAGLSSFSMEVGRAPFLTGNDRPERDAGITETTWFTQRGFLDAHQAATVIIPPDLPARLATLVEPLTSVLRAILLNPPRPGDLVMVLGGGPTGLLAAQVLRRCFGAGPVVVLERDSARLALATQLGADLALDPVSDSDALASLAYDHNGAYADYVFDALPHIAPSGPGSNVRSIAMRLLQAGGQYVLFGATMIPQSVDTWLVLAKGLRVVATPFDVRAFPMARTAHITRVALNLVTGRILDTEPLVTNIVPFTDEAGVRAAFSGYGQAGMLRTSICFAPANLIDSTVDTAEVRWLNSRTSQPCSLPVS